MNKILATTKSLHDKFCHYADFLQHPFLLFVRLYWGIQLMQSGWGKLHNLDKVTEFFTSLNLPMPAFTATAISSLEFFGGLLLAIGLFSRLISLVLTINMLMAYITADKEALHSIFSDPDKFTAAAPYEATPGDYPDLGTTQTIGGGGLLTDWAETRPQPRAEPGPAQAPWGPADPGNPGSSGSTSGFGWPLAAQAAWNCSASVEPARATVSALGEMAEVTRSK